MRMFAVATLVALGALVSWRATARADKLVIDRVESRPAVLHGQTRVRALISATATGGAVLEVPRDEKSRMPQLKLKVGGLTPPYLLGAFEHAEVEIAIVIALPTTLDFADDFEAMRASLDADLLEPLAKLGPRVRVEILGYGSELTGTKGFVRVADARKVLGELSPDFSADAIPLSEVATRAVSDAGGTIRKPKNKDALTRAAVVLVSKGIALSPDQGEADEVKRAISLLGKTASDKFVRIHTLAYSPSPDGKYHARRPLLALGELSRRSQGTFRWIQTEGGWKGAIDQVALEIQRQQVVTFFAPADELAGKKLGATMPFGTGELTADAVAVTAPKCGSEVCEGTAYCVKQVCVERRPATGGGLVVKVLVLGGVGIGAMAALLGILALVKRRRAAAAPPLPTATAMPGAPHGVPHGVPYGVPYGAAPAAPAPAPAAVPGGPVLIVLTGPTAGARLPLRHGFTVGKAPGSDLDLSSDGFASGNHAQIVFDGQSWTVQDHGSTNGTFANGVRITTTRLDPGMTIRFGSTEVRFWVG